MAPTSTAPQRRRTPGFVLAGAVARAGALALASAVALAACGSDDGQHEPVASRAPTTSTAPATTDPGTTSPPPVPPLRLEPIAHLDAPTALAVNPATGTVFATERAGRVVRLEPSGPQAATARPQVALDLREQVRSGGEQGLLGLAFAPDGRRLFIAYTNLDGDQQLDALGVDGDVVGDAHRVLVVDDFAPNHNGGALAFDPDGALVWAMGDGGGAGDPQGTGQDPHDLRGSLLRLDVSATSPAEPYRVPGDNPFADGSAGAPEVWAYGLRNPWRIAFDPTSGDLWIADVGQGEREEINLVRAAEGGGRGANFGWSAREGTLAFRDGTPPAHEVLPVHEYDHSGGRCSVTGGVVYRGTALAALQGRYLFGDFCDGGLHALHLDPPTDGAPPPTAQTLDLGLTVAQLSTFGVDAHGEVLVASLDGTVSRLVAH